MAIKTKFFLIFFIILLVPCILLKTYQKTHLENSPLRYNAKLDNNRQNNQWICWLNDQEKQVWDEVTSATGLTHERCLQLKNEWHADYNAGEELLHTMEKDQAPISTTTLATIDTLLGDFNLSTHLLPVIAWKDSSAAAATDSKLLINEKTFNTLPLEAKKFLIGHEVQHFLHKDTSTRYVLERFYCPEKELPANHPVYKLYRFQELRADIQSALTGPDYMQGYIAFIEILAQEGEAQGITHPKHSIRLSMGQKLLNNLPIA